jgi:hypothetical protein
LLKKLRVVMMMELVMMRELVSLKGLEKIAAINTDLVMMVMVGEGLRSPWIRQGELETGTVGFRHWWHGVSGVQSSLPESQIHFLFSPPACCGFAVWRADLQRQIWLCRE